MQESAPPNTAPASRILVADDDPGTRAFLRDSLEEAGYEVIDAADGRKAVDLLQHMGADLCIVDLAMPEQEGIETIQLIRGEYPAMKIIAISGAFGPSILGVSKQLGAAATLEKPIRPEKLLRAVEQLLGQ